ncbi:MAG: bifunctional phosphoglucose/phosphomannose isomerase [Chitinophagales bacterium]|nr:bifunctional phosphoglucose/phosphomannose isomerase [Chitinophagales bacterium]MDW8274368.1 bifunctional phosphoglucose/phosphomannose isomerase [Chitinophagales bacterium]
MIELIERFPQQLRHATQLLSEYQIYPVVNLPKNVIVSGLGGSGIGGHAIIELCADELKVPVVVNNSYTLPNFASSDTLILLSSYSGNTEETLSVAQQTYQKGLKAICITSGGSLASFARDVGWQVLFIPSGMPPRCGFGYSVMFQLHTLHAHHLISDSFDNKASDTADMLEREQDEIKVLAQQIALKLHNRFFAIFADQWFHSLVIRAKQQFNENSKSLCWANVFPEMNHNELVAWRGSKENISILIFRSSLENERNKHRIAFTKEVIHATGAEIIEVFAKGKNHFEQYFFHVHLTDWISYYLAKQQNFDPMEIEVLNKLKAHLASIK